MILPPSLVDTACDEIKRLISTRKLEPDERLLEAQLSEQLGISRPPLREALRILAAQHILEFQPRRGYRVAPLNADDADEIYSLRLALERFALDQMTGSLDVLDLTAMEETLTAWRAAVADEDDVAVLRANRQFHIEFVRLSNHRHLQQTYQTLMEKMELYMSRNITAEAQSVGTLEAGLARHEYFMDRIRTRDRMEIERALLTHGERLYLDHDE